jgi:outer membrane protein OmpA-like peptidoglycan-associated protein
MIRRVVIAATLASVTILGASGCATKKYARNRINERVVPLEARTGELEETSRRNSQEIARLSEGVTEVRGRIDRTQTQADAALTRAQQAGNRASVVEQSIGDLRANLDQYHLQNTATVNFAFDRYDLLPEAMMALDQLAAQIKDRENFVLEIEGFADAIGSDRYNNDLTQKRADSVRRYLGERHGIALFRMHILGFGEVRPVADNATREGRAQNRRVEVRLLTRNVTRNATAKTGS